MRELITTKLNKGNSKYFTNELIEEIDKHLIFERINNLQTYILGDKPYNSYYAIRYPGATRGGIKVDENNVITHIVIEEGFYKESVQEGVKEFIGCKIVFE